MESILLDFAMLAGIPPTFFAQYRCKCGCLFTSPSAATRRFTHSRVTDSKGPSIAQLTRCNGAVDDQNAKPILTSQN
jgi:hypothetical protein